MSSELLWVNDFLSDGIGQQRDTLKDLHVVRGPSADLCVRCRGGRMLCGKLSCPLLAKARAIATYGSLVSSEVIDGSTPPGVFVGRFGYPRVSVGPLIPPYHGDTTIFDTPELWLGKTIQEIVDMRYSLVRGKTRVSIFDRAGALRDSRSPPRAHDECNPCGIGSSIRKQTRRPSDIER